MNAVTPISIAPRSLDQIMPLYVIMDVDGRVFCAGRTLVKIIGGASLTGRAIADFFTLRRRSRKDLIAQLREEKHRKVHVRLRDAYATQMIAVAAPLPDGKTLINLSFGISIFDAVARYHLAGSDFAPTDLTLEMLYLAEANNAVMAESRALNERLHGAKAIAEEAALTDTLTGLSNRRALQNALDRLIERKTPFTLTHLDLDFFKAVNDTHGHAAGDFVLTQVARILLEEVRANDCVARVGGDEFVLVFHDLVDKTRLSRIAVRIIKRLETPMIYRGTSTQISASLGMVCSTDYEPISPDQMAEDADTALYASKQAGRAQSTFFQ